MNINVRCTHLPAKVVFLAFLLLALLHPADRLLATNWSLTPPLNEVVLDTSSAGFPVGEMSGVTYLGSSPKLGMHRFAVVQDSALDVVLFDSSFTPTGSLLTAKVVGRITLPDQFDFEGVVKAGSSLFVSEENSPGVREYDYSGNELQSVAIPSVFADYKLPNKGFESLARNGDGTKMWTANEEALTVDGPTSSPTQGTLVRIQEFDVSGSSLTPARQLAYEVDAVHASGIGANFRGLSELVAMPDGTLLALERSFAGLAGPTHLSSIYEIDSSLATDVTPFDQGLDGETFTNVGKTELWSGSLGGGEGQNIEGLTVGPHLPNGKLVLLGVVDDQDIFSNNTIVSFALSPMAPIVIQDTADYDEDGDDDGRDFLRWQRGFGIDVLAGLGDGDGTHDGLVNDSDLAVWKTTYGNEMVANPDFDSDNDIDAKDFLDWQLGFHIGTTRPEGDANNSGSVDGIDLMIWEQLYGTSPGMLEGLQNVPEPSSLTMWALGVFLPLSGRLRLFDCFAKSRKFAHLPISSRLGNVASVCEARRTPPLVCRGRV